MIARAKLALVFLLVSSCFVMPGQLRAQDSATRSLNLAAEASKAMDRGDYASALRDFEEAVRNYPGAAPNQLYLGRGAAYAGVGNHEKAVLDFTMVVVDLDEVDEVRVEARLRRAQSRMSLGDENQALRDYESALDLAPSSVMALNGMAWFLATTPQDTFRDPERAVELANRAAELLAEPHPAALDTLAAAYAAKGEFEKAIISQEKALDLIGESSPSRGKMTKRLELYRKGEAFVREVKG